MRILLFNPLHDPTYSYDYMDLGLGYLASSLRAKGHSVRLALHPAEFPTEDSFLSFLRKERFDLIGLKLISSSVRGASATVTAIRGAIPEARIVAGGPHVSGEPKSVFKLVPDADYAFYSEGEVGFTRLVDLLSGGSSSDAALADVPNLVWRKGPEVVVNPQTFVQKLDDLPFPAWELMDPRTFSHISYNGYSRRHPIAPFLMSRGCPFRCTFCAASLVNGYEIRARSADNVMEELRLLTGKFGVRELQFFDSNCGHHRGPLREVCRRIITEKIDITWNAPVGIRLDAVDAELATLMKRSGCFQVSVGIETASARILKMIKKQQSPRLIRDKVQILRQAGIEVLGSFIIGFPGESREEVEETISFALELPLTAGCFSILTPMPGSELCRDLFPGKEMDFDTLSTLDHLSYRNDLSQLPYEELRRAQKLAYWRFHLRPRILGHLARNLNSIPKIRYLLQRVYLDTFHE